MSACMFPGQGAQFPGMGKELFERYRPLCQLADQTLGYSIEALCLGTDARLNATEYTQPAIFFVSCLSYLERSRDSAFAPRFFLGHSLGLYAALFAAGVFDLADGLRIVARRGQLMAQAGDGAMLAVLGAGLDSLPSTLMALDFHDVDIANINDPGQVVLSGKPARIGALAGQLEASGLRCIKLPVSGAFHSRYMAPARAQFIQFLQAETLRAPRAAVVSSTSAETLKASHLIEELGFQLTKPVRWMQTVRSLRERHGVRHFHEVGPGQVLTRLNERIFAHA